MDNNDTYLHLSKCLVVFRLLFRPGSVRAVGFHECGPASCVCVLSEVRLLQTDFVLYAHKLYVPELSARSCHVY